MFAPFVCACVNHPNCQQSVESEFLSVNLKQKRREKEEVRGGKPIDISQRIDAIACVTDRGDGPRGGITDHHMAILPQGEKQKLWIAEIAILFVVISSLFIVRC